MCVLSISCWRAIFTGFVVWDTEELEVVEGIVGVQPAFPNDLTAALLHDRALAAAERDKVAALSKLLHGDQVGPGTEVWETGTHRALVIRKLSQDTVPTPATVRTLPSCAW